MWCVVYSVLLYIVREHRQYVKDTSWSYHVMRLGIAYGHPVEIFSSLQRMGMQKFISVCKLERSQFFINSVTLLFFHNTCVAFFQFFFHPYRWNLFSDKNIIPLLMMIWWYIKHHQKIWQTPSKNKLQNRSNINLRNV